MLGSKFQTQTDKTLGKGRCPQPSVIPVSIEGQGESLTLASFFCTGCGQECTVQCEPLQIVALKTKLCWLHSLFLSQRRVCASISPLMKSCATPLACYLLLCCKSWILQVKAMPLCHKLWAVQGISDHLPCVQHGCKIDHFMELAFAVTEALASALKTSAVTALQGCEAGQRWSYSLSADK